MLPRHVGHHLRVEPGSKVRLKDHDSGWADTKELRTLGKEKAKRRALELLEQNRRLLDAQKLPPGERDERFWETRYGAINAFEHHLVRNGTIVLKFFLHVSKHEQKRRFLERLDDPAKNWKFSAADLAERAFWKNYMA